MGVEFGKEWNGAIGIGIYQAEPGSWTVVFVEMSNITLNMMANSILVDQFAEFQLEDIFRRDQADHHAVDKDLPKAVSPFFWTFLFKPQDSQRHFELSLHDAGTRLALSRFRMLEGR